MRAHHLLIVILAIGGLVASFYLLPRPEERAAMYLRDGNSAAAIEVLRAAVDRNDDKPQLTRQLAELYEQEGQIEQAIAMMRKFLQQRPDNADGWQRLSALFDADGKRDGLTTALQQRVELAPSAKTVRQLIGIYRLDGQFEQEARLIQQFADTSFVDLPDIQRASALFIAAGKAEAAINLLRRSDRRAPPSHQASRLLLFDAMLIKKYFGEAAHISIQWLKAWNQPWLIDHMVLRMARVAPRDQAAAFAIRATQTSHKKRLQVVTALIGDGHRKVVRLMLSQLLEDRVEPTQKQFADYLALAKRADGQDIVASSFKRALDGGMSDQGQARFAEVLFDEFGPNFLAGFRLLQRPKFTARLPVLAADLALAQNSVLAARLFLSKARLTELSVSRRERWLSLAQSVWPKRTVLEMLDALGRQAALPRDMFKAYERLSRQLGRHNENRAAWRMIAASGN